MATIPAETLLSKWLAVPLFVLIVWIFDRFAGNIFASPVTHQTSGYFKAEKRASLGALVIFAVLVFGLDLKYYFAFLSLNDSVPALVNIAGLSVFLFLFAIIWRRSRKSYQAVFGRQYTGKAFIFSNIKANLPIIAPWVILTLFFDLINILPWPWLEEFIKSEKGDLLVFGIFFLFVFIFFPPLVRRLWGCKKLDEGPLKDHLSEFCKAQDFSATIYVWPLFEGRVITAGVMGLIPGLRYILITPALIETMTLEELDAVMAHEIGHVKRFHLVLYVLLIGGFIITSSLLGEPLLHAFFAQDFFYSFVDWTGFSPEAMRNVAIGLPTLFFLLLYFRYVFGYFMRNFERQADLHVFPVLGNSRAIISAFEKIAYLSGNIRNKPSWHHFGIGQRIDYLLKCEQNPYWIKHQHRKIGLSLGLFLVIFISILIGAQQFPMEEAKAIREIKYLRADLLYRAKQMEYPAYTLLKTGDYYLDEDEQTAVIAYELALEMEPELFEIQNNMAWLLLTSKEISLRNPVRALSLSRSAAQINPAGFVLDTLAVAWWANGFTEEAIKTENQAIHVDPGQISYYQSQIERFKALTYPEEVERQSRQNLVTTKNEKEEDQG